MPTNNLLVRHFVKKASFFENNIIKTVPKIGNKDFRFGFGNSSYKNINEIKIITKPAKQIRLLV